MSVVGLASRGRAVARAARHVNTLPKTPANFAALTPLDFLERAALVFPDSEAVRHGALSRSWSETRDRAVALASALRSRFGVGRDDVVQCMLANTPEFAEAHFGVPMSGATLGSINTRLDARAIAFILRHSRAKLFVVDSEFAAVARAALAALGDAAPPLVAVLDGARDGADGAADAAFARASAACEYEELVAEGDAAFAWPRPDDEWDALALNYTSGTTGDPKGSARARLPAQGAFPRIMCGCLLILPVFARSRAGACSTTAART